MLMSGINRDRLRRLTECPRLQLFDRSQHGPQFMSVCLGKSRDKRKIMRKHSLLLAAAALLVISGLASAQNQSPQDNSAPPALQSTTPDKPPVATIPEAATDVAGIPRRAEITGQAPNVSKKMGAEMDSAGDQRASPDEQ
jgi:hypothetical protein